MIKLEYHELTYEIRGAIFEVHNALGPGFKELVYHNALKEEFDRRGIEYTDKEKI